MVSPRPRTLALAVGLLATLLAPSASDAGRSASAGVRTLRQLSALRGSLQRHAYTAETPAIVERELARVVDNVGPASFDRITERRGWIPLGLDPQVRRVTVATVVNKLRMRSRELLRRIDAAPHAAAWDVVFIGAGVHTSILANVIAQGEGDRKVRMLAVDAADDVGGTLRRVGSVIGRNSANRAPEKKKHKGGRRRGFGNRNPLEGPWSDPDLDGQEWPDLGLLADSATVNLFAADADVALETRFVRTEERHEVLGGEAWPKATRVTLVTGTTVRYVYADRVVRAPGSGTSDIRGVDDATRDLVEAQKRRHVETGRTPDVMTQFDAMAIAQRSPVARDHYRAPVDPPHPFRQLVATQYRTTPAVRLWVKRLGGSAEEVPLDEVAAIAQDGDHHRVTLFDGRVLRASKVRALIGDAAVPHPRGDDLGQLVARIRAPSPGGAAVEVEARTRTRWVRQEREELRPKARMATLRGLAGRGGAIVLDPADGGGTFRLDELKDVRRQATADPAVVRYTLTTRDGAVHVGRAAVLHAATRGLARADAAIDLVDLPEIYAEPARPRIAVVGGGDSGRSYLEWLYGQAPQSAYVGNGRRDTAGRGDVGDVKWFVGEHGPNSDRKFLKRTRSRYLRLAGKVRHGADGAPRAELAGASVTQVSELPDGRYRVTSNGESEIFDRVIFATGLKPHEVDGELAPIRGKIDGLKGERVLGKRVAGTTTILIGPGAGPADVVGDDEVLPTREDAGSVNAFAGRDRALARQLLAEVTPTATALPRRPAPRLALRAVTTASLAAPSRRLLETPLGDVVLRAELADTLAQVVVPGRPDALHLEVRRIVRNGQARIELRGLGAHELATLVAANPLLLDQLDARTRAGELEVRARLRGDRIDRTSLKLTY